MMGLHGDRPVTLIGYSLGARLVFYCLLELERHNARGIVEHAIMLGAPVRFSVKEWTAARQAVSGRIINGYSKTDWILGFFYKSTKGFILKAAGLSPIELDGIENLNLTSVV